METITVAAFAAQGAPPGFRVTIETFRGPERVGYVREGFDGLWVVCPDANSGFGLSFAVTPDQPLQLEPQE